MVTLITFAAAGVRGAADSAFWFAMACALGFVGLVR